MFDLDGLDELEKKEEGDEKVSAQNCNGDPSNMNIDVAVAKDADKAPTIPGADSSLFVTPKASNIGNASSSSSLENDYLVKHGISEMLDEAILVLTYEQPEDPHAFLIDCIKKHKAEQDKNAASNSSSAQESTFFAMSKRMAAWWRSVPPEPEDSEELKEAVKKLQLLEAEMDQIDQAVDWEKGGNMEQSELVRIKEEYKAILQIIQEEQDKKEEARKKVQEAAENVTSTEATGESSPSRSSFIASSASVLSDIVVSASLPKISSRSFSGLFSTSECSEPASPANADAAKDIDGDSVENPQEAQESVYDYAVKKTETVKESAAALGTAAKEYSNYALDYLYKSQPSAYLSNMLSTQTEVLRSLKEGQKVVAKEDFATNSKTPLQVKVGQVGMVKTIDEDGDAEIDFEGCGSLQWVFRRNFHKLASEATDVEKENNGEVNEDKQAKAEEKDEKKRGDIAWQQVFGIKM